MSALFVRATKARTTPDVHASRPAESGRGGEVFLFVVGIGDAQSGAVGAQLFENVIDIDVAGSVDQDGKKAPNVVKERRRADPSSSCVMA